MLIFYLCMSRQGMKSFTKIVKNLSKFFVQKIDEEIFIQKSDSIRLNLATTPTQDHMTLHKTSLKGQKCLMASLSYKWFQIVLISREPTVLFSLPLGFLDMFWIISDIKMDCS
jgi:hypothetical protein